jgi:hypothetical protein
VQRIWYVAYGSNLSRERFCRYLRGGRPDGVERDYPGCRDTSDELDSFGLLITGGVYFAGRSSGWRAGMAFYDPEAPGEVAARAYLITAEQFVDVLAQETRRSPGMTLDLRPVFRGERYSNGVGGYPVLVRVGDRHGLPLVTFTREGVLHGPSWLQASPTWRLWRSVCVRPTGGPKRRSIAICRRYPALRR